jgi:hypothetical protein
MEGLAAVGARRAIARVRRREGVVYFIVVVIVVIIGGGVGVDTR